MRWIKALFPFLLTVAVVMLLDRPLGALPALGRLLDPVAGALAAAEDVDHDFGGGHTLKGLQAPVQVWYDHRLVPHIRAQNNHDLYLAQGYIHATFRLWQMDLQTRAAAGRVSEVLGPKAVDYDRGQRRKGMVYAAEQSLRAMEADPRTKESLDAYRDGINQYVASLNYRRRPLEYKLMGFSPEKWTNIRTALLLKYMADDLTGYTEDIPLTYLRDRLSKEDFDLLYPLKIPGSKHVVPEGTPHPKASMVVPPVPGDEDSLFAHFGTAEAQSRGESQQADESGKGSNSWVISPKLTASGAAILCNDPHLALNLPSLWFEVQLQAPGINCYGVSLPGAPGVIIGFNDSVSWGLTNNYRDVKDYYEIHPADANNYWFDGARKSYAKRIERIGVKGGAEVLDTVLYTIHGPVQYDAKNPSPDTAGRVLAMCWTAHRSTNELLAVWKWNRATDVASFRDAIQHFECPAQNFAYADRAGNYAQFTQGRYINKWPGQGRFVMNGSTSKTLWGANIPMEENPFALNHPQGYLLAANQSTTDDTYPYWYNGTFHEWRAWRIFEIIAQAQDYQRIVQKKASVTEIHVELNTVKVWQLDVRSTLTMQLYNRLFDALQKEEWERFHSLFPESQNSESDFLPGNPGWNFRPNNSVATLFHIWQGIVLAKMARKLNPDLSVPLPSSERLLSFFCDSTLSRNVNDSEIKDLIREAFRSAGDSLLSFHPRVDGGKGEFAAKNWTEWYRFKNTHINHLTKIPAFGFGPLKVGGWGTTINANKVDAKGQAYGPSWRMIVEMSKDSIRAYGHYPGGQSGNVGSKWYANMLNDWVEGKYHRLLFFLSGVQPKKEDVMLTLLLNPNH